MSDSTTDARHADLLRKGIFVSRRLQPIVPNVKTSAVTESNFSSESTTPPTCIESGMDTMI